MTDFAFDYDAEAHSLTIAAPHIYMTLSVRPGDLARLTSVATADWLSRSSIQAGQLLGHPVFWCAGEVEGAVNVMAGPDDDTWQLLLTVPGSLVSRMAAANSG